MSEQPATYRARHLLPLSQLPPAQPRPRGGSRPYRLGASAERELVREFFVNGALCIRSSGSAGPYDLCVVLPGGGRLLQVKKCGVTPSEATIVRWLGQMPDVPDGWSAELWYRTPRGWSSIAKQGRVP